MMKTVSLPTALAFAGGVTLMAVIVLSLLDNSNESTVGSVGSTYGRIFVDSPEVYTRERMVNDRFRQEAWLLEQLRQDSGPRIQGQLGTESSKSLDVNVSTQLATQTEQEGLANQTDGSDKSNGDRPEGEPPQKPQLSAIEEFRSRQAYREEIRNAIIENQLDDRHDLNGNTLYRLKFDATVIPGNDTSAWAEVKVKFGNGMADEFVELKTTYDRWIEDVEKRINGRVRGRVNKAEDKKSKYDAIMSATEAWAFFFEGYSDFSQFQNYSDIPDFVLQQAEFSDKNYEDLIEFLKYEISCDNEADCLTMTIIIDEVKGLNTSLSKVSTKKKEITPSDGSVGEEESDVEEEYIIVTGMRRNESFFLSFDNNYVAFELMEKPVSITVHPKIQEFSTPTDYHNHGDDKVLENGECQSYWSSKSLGEANSTPVTVNSVDNGEPEQHDFKTCNEVLKDTLSGLATSFLEIRNASSDGIKVKTLYVQTGLSAFRKRLNEIEPKELFTYAVTPRESTQQISSSSQLVVAEQIRVAAAGAIGTQGIAADAGSSSLFSEYARFLDSRPVVVGISSYPVVESKPSKFNSTGTITSNTKVTGSANSDVGDGSKYVAANGNTPTGRQVAEFGWLIGPKLVVGSDGLAKYRHHPSQNSLAALISVPSWWRRADITIATDWLDGDGEVVKVGATSTFDIALPGDTEEITSLMLLGGKRPPPIIQSVESVVIIVDGESEYAEILIAGEHLWRSSVVTIGSLRSKQISVLPNMKGIIARFGAVELKAILDQSGEKNLRVWTSEDVVDWTGVIVITDTQQ